ncbi:hypothetical protein [Jidongwangia harbinensis]|uniref:hypothetical protein n=1 Tax=Jidongwangia harbinensis TaxID=2878561 RepID=UPI001CDA3582|nr:hypothetical protein [Jidongwangia harbinensis]MCA2217152.1 hypothetical protein [Jidongwangia harbinensis]
MAAMAAGAFRRTAVERSDQRVSWERPDQAFFAAGACHVLAWACRDAYADRPVELAALVFEGRWQPFHVYASWEGWAFDHSGWNPESHLIEINADFERRMVQRVSVGVGLDEFCETYHHRRPDQFWRDPRPRARAYLSRSTPPWDAAARR